MKRNRKYVPDTAVFPHLGLDTLNPSDMMEANYSPNMLNVDVLKGLLSKRTGYSSLTPVIAQDETILGIVEFEDLYEGFHLVCFTTKRQYVLDSSSTTLVWRNITQVDPDSTLEVLWSGTEDDYLDFESAVGTDKNGNGVKWLIATNGKDAPVYWDGNSNTFLKWKPDIDDFITCRTIRMFFDHLVVSNITSSDKFGQIVAWSETGSLTNFSNSDNFGGMFQIPSVEGEFIRSEALADRLALYTSSTITLMTYVGGTQIYSAETVTREIRLLSGRSVSNLGNYHVFISQENIYYFDGSSTIRKIGDPIFRDYINQLYLPNADRAFVFNDVPKQQAYFVIPTESDSGHLIYKLEYDLYNLNQNKWTVHNFADRPTCMGFWTRETDLFFDDLFCQNTSFSDANFPWNSAGTKKGFPIKVFGTVTGQPFQIDETSGLDGVSNTIATWDSKDFTVPAAFISEYGRWIEIEASLSGNTVDVYYSTNEGEGYTLIQSVDLQNDFRKYRIPIDIMSKTLRIRFANLDANSFFNLRWLGIWVTPGGPTSGDVQ